MSRIPSDDDGPTYRRTTIRRRKGDEADDQDDAVTTDPVQAAVAPPAPPAPAEPEPVPEPRAAPPPRPNLDPDALLAELEGFNQDELAALLSEGAPVQLEPGDEVQGVVVRANPGTVFVDIGAKSEAWLARADFGDEDVAIGDPVTAWVLTTGGRGLRLTRQLTGGAGVEALENAAEAGIPVEGRVESRNTGGFVIAMGSVRAFCPVSHIDRTPEADLDAYIGRAMTFRILEVRGRDVVVSHRAIADEEAEVRATELWATVKPGDVLEGAVSGHKPYGVFVDVGGITGLVHKSELGWGDDLTPPPLGTRVTVNVVEVEAERGRLSLSLKDQVHSPWTLVGTELVEGEVYEGKVTRLADFGAFIEVLPGLSGLAHVSTLAEGRVEHPSDVLTVGQTIRVRILSVDLERERIELGVRQAADGWSADDDGSHQRKRGGTKHADGGSLGTLADLLGGLKLS